MIYYRNWYNKAIEIKPLTETYTNRGNAYSERGDFDRAIEEYKKAIELKPDFAGAYYSRGVTRLYLGEWEKAKADLTTAKEKGENIIASFHDTYESVSDFKGKHGIQLPADIAEMLSPNPVNPQIL